MSRLEKRRKEILNDLFKKSEKRHSTVTVLPKLTKKKTVKKQEPFKDQKNYLPDIKNNISDIKDLKQSRLTHSIYLASNDSLFWLNEYDFKSPFNTSDSFSNKSIKIFVNNKNLSKLKALMIKSREKFGSADSQNWKINESQSIKLRLKFKKLVKILIIALRLVNLHKIDKDKNLYNLDINLNYGDEIFDKRYFNRITDLPFPDEVKKMLLLDPNERTEDIIRQITISLSLSMPEFLDFPSYMQRMISKYAYYAEFTPNRVIIRQGHIPENYYIVISGSALEIKNNLLQSDATPVSVFKRGDSFGDKSIINNTLRSSSVTVSGNRPICLLSIEKEDFFRIQTPVSSREERMEFLTTKVKLLNFVKYDFQLLESENKNNRAMCSIFYKNGQVICENSQKDAWIYVVKSGSCKVLKKIKFNHEALDEYLSLKKHQNELKQLVNLYDIKSRTDYGQRKIKKHFKNSESKIVKNDDVYLEMMTMKEGDIFGLHDIILCEEDDLKFPLILSSNGCECILLNRLYFLRHLQSQALLTLRFNLHPYPDDDCLIKKYFNSFEWKDFTEDFLIDTLRNINVKNSIKTFNI